MKRLSLRSLLSAIATAVAAASLASCFSNQPIYGGFASKLGDPLGALEDEPAPTPPNPHLDPVQERYGAISVRFTEDLEKSANNHRKADPGRR